MPTYLLNCNRLKFACLSLLSLKILRLILNLKLFNLKILILKILKIVKKVNSDFKKEKKGRKSNSFVINNYIKITSVRNIRKSCIITSIMENILNEVMRASINWHGCPDKMVEKKFKQSSRLAALKWIIRCCWIIQWNLRGDHKIELVFDQDTIVKIEGNTWNLHLVWHSCEFHRDFLPYDHSCTRSNLWIRLSRFTIVMINDLSIYSFHTWF